MHTNTHNAMQCWTARSYIWIREPQEEMPCISQRLQSVLTKSTLSSASQWKDFRNRRTVKSATNFGLKSSRKTVKARQVSVTAYHDRSMRCCNKEYETHAWYNTTNGLIAFLSSGAYLDCTSPRMFASFPAVVILTVLQLSLW